MSNISLCIHELAATPYYIQSAGIHIYSVEELCFCLCEYTAVLDKDTISQELCAWMERQPGLKGLGGRLLEMVRQGRQLKETAGVLFRETGFCNEQQISRVIAALGQAEAMDPALRKKQKADYLMRAGRYSQALNEYHNLLEAPGPEADQELQAVVLHNIGAAYGRLFEFSKAAAYYKQSFAISKDRDTLKQYLAALRLYLPKEDYLVRLKEEQLNCQEAILVEEELEISQTAGSRIAAELREYREQGEVLKYYELIHQKIAEWKDDYRRNMMNV